MKLGKEGLKKVQIGLLCLLALGMPNENLLMSIPTILLFFLWFIEPGLKEGTSRLTFKNPATWMVGLFLVHIIWLINTSDWSYALKDLRIKLPLVVLALSVGTLKLSPREFKSVFAFLGLGLWIASLVGYYLYFSDPEAKLDPRVIVPDISHIRLSLMVVLFIGAVVYFLPDLNLNWKILGFASVLNFMFFLYLLQSLTAVIILTLAGASTAALYFAKTGRGKKLKALVLVTSGLIVIGIIGMVNYYQTYFTKSNDALPLLSVTESGTPYNYYDTLQIENGNIVFANICEVELSAEWNKRSDLKIGFDPAVNPELTARLIRYLTAKGLPKDSAAVVSLSDLDVERIESGYPAPAYAEKEGLILRIHSFLHGAHLFFTLGEVEGSSFFQRLVFWRVGWRLFEKNPIFGTGTGDVKQEIKAEYENYPVYIEPKYRLRAHNQYITFLMTFGIFGFLYFLLFLGYTLHRAKRNNLFFFFVLLSLLSFLTEDTLETQAGVTFFAFFLALFSAFRE